MGKPPETSAPAETPTSTEVAVPEPQQTTQEQIAEVISESGQELASLKFAMSQPTLAMPNCLDRLPETHPAHDMLGVLSFVAMTKRIPVILTVVNTADSKQDQWNMNVGNMESLIATVSKTLESYGIAQPTVSSDGTLVDFDARMQELMRTGSLQLSDTLTAYLDQFAVRDDRECFEMACRDFVRFIGTRTRLYVQPVQLSAGPALDENTTTLAEYDAYMRKYARQQGNTAGYMVAFEYEGKFYLGSYIYTRAERMEGKVDANYAIWQAIRYAHAPKMVSERDTIHFRREKNARQFRRQWMSTVKYHIDDIMLGTAAINDTIYARVQFRTTEDEQILDWLTQYEESGFTLEDPPPANTLASRYKAKKEELATAQAAVAAGGASQAADAPTSPFSNLTDQLGQLEWKIVTLRNKPTFDTVMTPEQREALFMVYNRLRMQKIERAKYGHKQAQAAKALAEKALKKARATKELAEDALKKVQAAEELAEDALKKVQAAEELAQQAKELAQQAKELAQQAKEIAQQAKELAQQARELNMTERDLLTEYGFTSDYLNAARSMRMTFEATQRSRAFVPMAGQQRMQTVQQLVKTLPWIPDEAASRQPLMDFYNASMMRHRKYKQQQATPKVTEQPKEQAVVAAGSAAEEAKRV